MATRVKSRRSAGAARSRRPAGAAPGPHEVAGLFPPMTDAEFEALKADIARFGLRDAITTYRGQVVDGGHRLRACRELGIEPRFVEWPGAGSLVDFVVSRNLHRRHLAASQRAMVAARIANLAEGRPAKTASKEAVSEAAAAARLKVGRSSVQKAKRVLRRGVPELVEAVDRDEVSVTAAAHVAELDAREQARVVAQGPEAIKGRARRARRPERAEAREPEPEVRDGRDADAEPVPVEPGDAGQADDAEDPQGDREWLESLPLWARLSDPAAFARDALAWRRLQPLVDRARREDSAFDREARLRSFGFTIKPQLLSHVAALAHPRTWRVCRLCQGTGADYRAGRCDSCRGDGFVITKVDGA